LDTVLAISLLYYKFDYNVSFLTGTSFFSYCYLDLRGFIGITNWGLDLSLLYTKFDYNIPF
jgi:hypothetical protein